MNKVLPGHITAVTVVRGLHEGDPCDGDVDVFCLTAVARSLGSMLEILMGSGLAAAAGLNAWMPLFALGLADRFVPAITLPDAWSWLSGDVALWITGILLVVEVVADKVPAVDSINDVIQTVVRPAAGGVAFGAGSTAESFRIEDPSSLFQNNAWIPVVIGVVIALGMHAFKAGIRPVANLATAGAAAPILSTAEDASALSLVVTAFFAPVLTVLIIVAFIVGAIVVLRRLHRRRLERESSAEPLL